MKKVTRFFWWCAGARTEILDQCPTDQSKYFGIGGTILFTAMMASFAGGYAFFTAFHSTAMSIPFGIFWGLLIFNLDRYIVATIGKGDGTAKITRDEWKNAAPRLLMAVLLGFVISTPLELKLFEKEINVEVENIIREERAKLGEGEVPILSLIAEKQNKIKQLKQEQISVETKADDLPNKAGIEDKQIELVNEEIQRIDGLIASNTNNWVRYNSEMQNASTDEDKDNAKRLRDRYGNGANNKRKAELLEQIGKLHTDKFERGKSYYKEADELKKINQPKIDAVEQEIKTLEAKLGGKRDENDEIAKQYSGLMARLEALSRLTDKYTVLLIVKWLITLLFVFIEVAPVLFKLMAESGPYDDIIDRLKHEINVSERQKISDLNDKINTDINISTEKNKVRLDAELKGNQSLLEAVALAQADIAKKAVEKWREKEMEKIEKSVSHIIHSSGLPEHSPFENKFWSNQVNGLETIYCFRNSGTNELWIKQNNQLEFGKWEKLADNKLKINISNNEKAYDIIILTDKNLVIHETETGNKMDFISVN